MSEQQETKLKEPVMLDPDVRRGLIEALLPARRRITYEEFLASADEDTLAEWVDGEVVMAAPASKRHQEIGGFLLHLITVHAEEHDLGVVLSPPFQMKLERSGREPDLIFVAKAHLDRLQETHLDGPADLAVEILSPESAGRDRGAKFYEYEAAGIPEYWLVDPLREEVEFHQLDEQGHYRLVLPDDPGVYASRVLPGFKLPIAWLWQPPHVLDALRELGLI